MFEVAAPQVGFCVIYHAGTHGWHVVLICAKSAFSSDKTQCKIWTFRHTIATSRSQRGGGGLFAVLLNYTAQLQSSVRRKNLTWIRKKSRILFKYLIYCVKQERTLSRWGGELCTKCVFLLFYSIISYYFAQILVEFQG